MRTLTTAVRTALATTITAVGLTASLSAQTASASDLDALREQIRLLDQKLRVLERNQELKDETAAADAKKQPKLTVSDGRIEVVSADGANSLRLRGLVQGDGRFYFDDANAAQDGFLLRRARLIFEGKFADRFTYVIQPEFGGSTIQLLDANVGIGLTPDLTLLAGRFKLPVGLEQLQSDPVAFFNERSVATNLAPNRDVGLQLAGTVLDKRLAYQAAVVNGLIDGGNSPASGVNQEGDLTVAGRLFATPFINNKDSVFKGLGFGAGGATGNYRGAASNSLLNSYRTDGQQTFFQYRSNATPTLANTTVANGNAFVISPQAYFYSGPLGILAEYFTSSSDISIGSGPTLNQKKIKNTAYNLSVGYVLTGEDSSFKGVTPKTNFNPTAGTWGAFEVVARFANVDIDNAAFTDPDGGGAATSLAAANNATEVNTYGLGLNWYLSKSVRVNLNVFKNDFKLAPGNTVPATGNALSDDELVFISRVQVSF
jgi:phosphate-selective porin OprO and OprP